jgi:hypothetical protein
MVYVEAPISGTSTNPARSLGPAIVSGQWQGFWIYLLGPVIGMLGGWRPAAFWPSVSRLRSYTISTVTMMSCSAGQLPRKFK